MNVEELNVMKHIIDLVCNNIPVLVFCNSYLPIIQRAMAIIADVDYAKIKTGNLNEEEWKQIDDRTPKLENAPFYINDKEIGCAEGYITEILCCTLHCKHVFINNISDSIDKNKLVSWCNEKGLSLTFTDFNDTID